MNKEQDTFLNIARPEVREFKEYNPGVIPEDCLKMHANENNSGVSPKALSAMCDELKRGNRYPESRNSSLRKKIASIYNLNENQILTGNGLDSIFTMLGRAFLNKEDEVVCGEFTFSVYADTARIMGAVPVFIPMTDNFELDVDAHINAINENTKMVFFCNPNNPTGTAASLYDIERLINASPKTALFILDEAYIDFSGGKVSTALSLLNKYPNLVVCRTFSKIYGLAGLRVGWIAANPELLKYIYRVREPYCVTEIAAAGAEAALEDRTFITESLETELKEKEKLCAFLDSRNIKYVPSFANFLLLLVENAEDIYSFLIKKGILVRLLTYNGRKMLRISIGMPEENRLLEKSLSELIPL